MAQKRSCHRAPDGDGSMRSIVIMPRAPVFAFLDMSPRSCGTNALRGRRDDARSKFLRVVPLLSRKAKTTQALEPTVRHRVGAAVRCAWFGVRAQIIRCAKRTGISPASQSFTARRKQHGHHIPHRAEPGSLFFELGRAGRSLARAECQGASLGGGDAQRQAWRWTRRDGSGARGSARAGRFLCLSRRTADENTGRAHQQRRRTRRRATGATHQRRAAVG